MSNDWQPGNPARVWLQPRGTGCHLCCSVPMVPFLPRPPSRELSLPGHFPSLPDSSRSRFCASATTCYYFETYGVLIMNQDSDILPAGWINT